MIILLPLQEFMSLTFIHKKNCAFAPSFIFYVDSVHMAQALYQVPPKLFWPSICIKLIVALAPTIPQVNSPMSLTSISALSMTLFGVALGRSPT
ncbi:hypothetical protein GW17_00054596 [Ensete ventricosum]|nr:hypothetical protein GW17_00054596 [Ensete ventricosum]